VRTLTGRFSLIFLSTGIGLDLQGIINPVYQVGEGNDHRQLDNFIFGIISPYIPQNVGIDRGGPTGNDIGQANGDFFFLVEYLTALVKSQCLYLFVGDTGLLRRSSVVMGSVAAVIDAGCFQIGQLLVFGVNDAPGHNRIVKRYNGFQGGRKSGDDPEYVGHSANVILNLIIDSMQLSRCLLFG
jgi:hypothetical protein